MSTCLGCIFPHQSPTWLWPLQFSGSLSALRIRSSKSDLVLLQPWARRTWKGFHGEPQSPCKLHLPPYSGFLLAAKNLTAVAASCYQKRKNATLSFAKVWRFWHVNTWLKSSQIPKSETPQPRLGLEPTVFYLRSHTWSQDLMKLRFFCVCTQKEFSERQSDRSRSRFI